MDPRIEKFLAECAVMGGNLEAVPELYGAATFRFAAAPDRLFLASLDDAGAAVLSEVTA